jgi:hypothetical protein
VTAKQGFPRTLLNQPAVERRRYFRDYTIRRDDFFVRDLRKSFIPLSTAIIKQHFTTLSPSDNYISPRLRTGDRPSAPSGSA